MATLVTGGCGFVGVNVVEALLERGDAVVSFDTTDLPAGAARALTPFIHRLHLERGSILDAVRMDALFERHRIDHIVHAAAVTSGPAREAHDPSSIVEVNLRGTIKVLEAARRHRVARFIYVGSGGSGLTAGAVYGRIAGAEAGAYARS